MSGTSVYLDANATERLRPEARDAAFAAFALDANPASVHRAGRAANRVLETARATISGAFSVGEDDVIFTSGGTEANALALHGLRAGRVVMIGATEHDRAAIELAALIPWRVILPPGDPGPNRWTRVAMLGGP